MDYDVRRIRADEWRMYRELRLEALKDAPLAFGEQYDDAVNQPDQYWQERVQRSVSGNVSSTFVLAERDRLLGKASCFVEADVADAVSAHVVGVYVSPGARGGGATDALMSAVIRWALDDVQAERIRLFAMQTNERALAFYRRIGFTPTGATMAYPPDPSYTKIEMEYRFPPFPHDHEH